MGPDLRLISLDDIQLQENADIKRVEKVVSAMKKGGLLKDPPIVAKGLGKRLIQLDGTTRLSAIKKLGCSHVVVQVVDYNDTSQVIIKSWVHVSKVDREKFLERIKEMKGVQVEKFKLGLGLTLTGHPLAVTSIIFRDGKGLSVVGTLDLVGRVKLMRRVVDLYSQLITRDWEVSIESMTQLKEFFVKHKDQNVALFFPSFSAHEIFSLMKKDIMLPQGITRHIINGRVLRINYPIEMLKEELTLEKKEKYFQQFLEKVNYRFYEESTFMVE